MSGTAKSSIFALVSTLKKGQNKGTKVGFRAVVNQFQSVIPARNDKP
jgi:hypothetical protein